ncbi:glutamine amidotransferase [Herbaspirillum robiniae]|uniref:glutamine amidotransferase n=1 Tax=Herbaspirillum robiniae TaxID=2014887 RepID=UPI003D77351B
MKPTVLALRHVHFEDLGNLAPILETRGYRIEYLDATVDNLFAIDASMADLMVVLGGPIGAFDEALYPFLEGELALVRKRLDSGRPLLGICLGAQLIARALGARVYPMGVKEIGFSPLRISAQGAVSPVAALADVPVLHWHGDQFDIPAGAVHLASTAIGANQAFSVGATVLGLQFHVEAATRGIERWLVGHANELGQCEIDPRTLRTDAAMHGGRLEMAAAALMSRWLDLAGCP